MPTYKLIKIYKLDAPSYWDAKKAFRKAEEAGVLERLLTNDFVKEDDQPAGWRTNLVNQLFGNQKKR